MTLVRVLRILARTLLVLQGGVIALCISLLVDALRTDYVSEWLTVGAFVPYIIVALIFYAFCMFCTYVLMGGDDRSFAWLWLVPLAFVTILPYVLLLLTPWS